MRILASSLRCLAPGLAPGVALGLALAGGCASTKSAENGPAPAAEPPAAAATPAATALSAEEQAAGFKLLFDGQTSNGWRGFKSDKFPDGWVIENGILKHPKNAKGGDIVTVDQYDNFELRFEFKMTEGANSGVKYLIDESITKGKSGLGFEYQILDDAKHPDAKQGRDGNRTIGALYDLITPATDKVVKPIGEWNEGRIVVDGTHSEHWLNGKKVVEYERGSDALKALIAQSKWKDNPVFGTPNKGHVLIQDHGDEVSFRNIRLRVLPPKAQPTAAK